MNVNALRSILCLVDPFNIENLTSVQIYYFSHRISATIVIHTKKPLVFHGSWHVQVSKDEARHAHMTVPLENYSFNFFRNTYFPIN